MALIIEKINHDNIALNYHRVGEISLDRNFDGFVTVESYRTQEDRAAGAPWQNAVYPVSLARGSRLAHDAYLALCQLPDFIGAVSDEEGDADTPPVKPTRPSIRHYWDWQTVAWIEEPRDVPAEIIKKTQLLNESCAAQITAGFTSAALGEPYVYDSEEVDQLNLIGAVMSGTDRIYKCTHEASGLKDWHLHTAAQLQQVLADGAAFKESCLTRATMLKAQAAAATTFEELEAAQW